MKPTLYITLSLIILLSSACQNPTGTPIETVYAQSIIGQSTAENIAMIYDYNEQSTRLEYRAVKVEQSTGDPIRDLVQTFIDQNSIVVSPRNLSLSQWKENEGQAIFSFTGTAQYRNPQDSLLFWEALDITLARNYKHHNFSIELIAKQSL